MEEETDTDETGNLRSPAAGVEQKARVIDTTKSRNLIVAAELKLKNRLDQYSAVTDAYDRIPPDSDEELRADGLGWASNVNWGGMEAGVEDAVGPLFNLMTEPTTFVKFQSELVIPGKASALRTLAEQDAKMVRRWSEWDYVVQQMLHYRVSFGLGILHWPMPFGWHCDALHPGNLITPEKASLNTEKWPWAAVKTEFEVSDLIAKLANSKEAAGQGWNIKEIKAALEKYKSGEGSRWPVDQDVDAVVNSFLSSPSWGTFDDTVTIKGYILYVREFDGTISEQWLTNQEGVGFLFQRKRKHSSMSRVISIFPHAIGDGFLNRVRGYGLKMLPYHDIEDRMLNHTIDVTMLAANLNLKGDVDDLNRLPELVFGPVTLVPDDMDIDQLSFSNPAQGLMQLRREVMQQHAGRNKVFGGEVDVSPNVDQTATGAKMRYQEQTKGRGYDVTRFNGQMSRFHDNRWARVTDKGAGSSDPGYEEAQEMLERAKSAGVPEELINDITGVTAKTIVGDGDPVNLTIALRGIQDLVGNFSAQGKQTWSRMVTAATLRSNDLADELHGEPGMDDLDSQQRRLAQLENAAFQTSDARIDVAGTDHHIIHAGEHTVFAEDTIGQINGGEISKEQGFSTLQRVKEHSIVHLQEIAADPLSEEIFQDLQRRWADIENTLRQIGQNLQAQRQAEQEQQLEELRNPRPSVKDLEVAETERLKRQTILEESAVKQEVMRKESDAKLDAAAAEAVASGSIIQSKEINTNTQ